MRRNPWVIVGLGQSLLLFGCSCGPVCVGTSKLGTAKADLATFHSAIALYRSNHDGEAPPELGVLCDPDPKNSGSPYLEVDRESLVDPWDRPYGYERSATGFRVYTLGADGLEGGEGPDADIELAR